jgi:hypothetical protein
LNSGNKTAAGPSARDGYVAIFAATSTRPFRRTIFPFGAMILRGFFPPARKDFFDATG